jgi:hypothetical protein
MTRITRQTTIEDLVDRHPASVRVFLKRGIQCLICGEPAWGTVEDLARGAGVGEQGIDELVSDLNMVLEKSIP